MTDGATPYPRAIGYLSALPKDAILRWLTESKIGRTALAELENKLAARPTDDQDS